MAATSSYPIENVWYGFGLQGFLYFIIGKGVGGGHRGPMAKFFSWTISIHDFELYPFDKELSYDFV